jgi:predicted AlkP superfamily pyrophosphatase or phosphodiesterase
LNEERISFGLLCSRVAYSVADWCRLFRIPNLLTVPGDPLAGIMLANAGGQRGVCWAIAASLSFYTGGLVLNDLADLEIDRRERPGRPLPSGKIALSSARTVCTALFVLGLSFSAAGGSAGFLVGVMLSGMVLAYNLRLKSLPVIGPISMGLCRGLSLVLGAVMARPGWPPAVPVIAAGWLALYIAAVTNLARDEAGKWRPGWREWLPPGVLAFGLAFLGIAFFRSKNAGVFVALLILLITIAFLIIATVNLRARDHPNVSFHIGFLIHLLLPIQASLCSISAPSLNEGVKDVLFFGLLWPITPWLAVVSMPAEVLMEERKLLVINVAALGWDLVSEDEEFGFRPIKSVFSALTCPVQATFRTGSGVREHGLVANGLFFPELCKVLFWEQAASLIHGQRIWNEFQIGGKTVGMMFWQQSLGEEIELVLSPAPIHKHGGGIIENCYSQPPELYSDLSRRLGKKFRLMDYWGPMASSKASDWIVESVCAVLESPAWAPDLLCTYLPHLDYDFQRFGPDGPQARRALDVLRGHLRALKATAGERGYHILIFGDYSIERVGQAIFPNRALCDAKMFRTRSVQGLRYPDFFKSAGFAMTDHQIAQVFTRGGKSTCLAKEVLGTLPGVYSVLDKDAQREQGIDHSRSGELVLVAKDGFWFAYPWWKAPNEAPDFASHVDIHNKPGYDPCELFFGWPPFAVSTDTRKVRGSHGRPGRPVAWTTTLPLETQPNTLVEMAQEVGRWLSRRG